MSFSEFREEVLSRLKEYISDPNYLAALEPDIKKHYDSEVRVSELLGEDQVSPSGYVLGILFMYPDLP